MCKQDETKVSMEGAEGFTVVGESFEAVGLFIEATGTPRVKQCWETLKSAVLAQRPMAIWLPTSVSYGDHEGIIYLLTTGSGADGDEWGVESVHRTREGAERAKAKYEAPRERRDESTYHFNAEVEEWEVYD
jgi:hypothetical protein